MFLALLPIPLIPIKAAHLYINHNMNVYICLYKCQSLFSFIFDSANKNKSCTLISNSPQLCRLLCITKTPCRAWFFCRDNYSVCSNFYASGSHTIRSVSQIRSFAMLSFYRSFVVTLCDVTVLRQGTRNCCDLVMPLDIQKYRHHVEDFDLSDKRKQELIQTVWKIMESFVDRAWGIHPLQQSSGEGADRDCQGTVRSIESKGSNPKTTKDLAISPLLESERDS